jgi:hypothetical protein
MMLKIVMQNCWFTHTFGGTYSIITILLTSDKTNLVFLICYSSFVLGDWGVLFAICFQQQWKIQILWRVTTLFKNFASLFFLFKMCEITGFLVIFWLPFRFFWGQSHTHRVFMFMIAVLTQFVSRFLIHIQIFRNNSVSCTIIFPRPAFTNAGRYVRNFTRAVGLPPPRAPRHMSLRF